MRSYEQHVSAPFQIVGHEERLVAESEATRSGDSPYSRSED